MHSKYHQTNFMRCIVFFLLVSFISGCQISNDERVKPNSGNRIDNVEYALPTIPGISTSDFKSRIVDTSLSLSVNWNIPLTKVDGASIAPEEISGFKIYVSKKPDFIPHFPFVTIIDGRKTSYIIKNLTSGTYYIYVTSYDIDGNESPYSDQISTTI